MRHSLLRTLKELSISFGRNRTKTKPYFSKAGEWMAKIEKQIHPSVRDGVSFRSKTKILDHRRKLLSSGSDSFFLRKCLESGVVRISTNSSESWNFEDEPKNKGEWDVDGHAYCDVIVTINFNLFKLEDLKWMTIRLLKWVPELLKDISSFGLIDGLEFWWRLRPTLEWSRWIFTVNSSYCAAEDLIEARAERDGWPSKKFYNFKPIEQFEKEIANIDRKELLLFLDSTEDRIGTSFWVSRNDPTSITFDESSYKYDKKDGWSMVKVSLLIQEWFDHMFLEDVKVVLKD